MPDRPSVAATGRGARSVAQGMSAARGANDNHLLMRRATGQLCENRSRVTGEVTSWGARFRYEGQRRYLTLEAESREEAVREMALLMFRVRRGIWEPPRKHRRHAPGPRPPKLADFAEDWLAGEKVQGGRRGTGLAPASYASLQWRLGHLLRFFASARLDEITVMDVDRYRQTKLGEGTLSADSINKTLLTLGAIFELAIEYGLVAQNPTHGRRRRLPVSKPRRAWLDRTDHIVALLDAAGEFDREAQPRCGHRRVLLSTLVFAGLRISEALALRWGEIDLARGTLRVDQAKTDAGVRTINLLPVLRDELREYKARGEHTARQFVFATSTERAVTATNVRKRILQPAIIRANETLERQGEAPLPEAITPHALRRTFASLLFAIGESPPYVINQLGHATPALTLEIYARQMNQRDGESARLQDLVEGRLQPGVQQTRMFR
jgi:integrase